MRSHPFLFSALLSLTLALAGCGPSTAAICLAQCDCNNCPEGHFDSCVSAANAEERNASLHNCEVQYEQLLNCENATGFCNLHGDYETSCHAEQDDLNRCLGPDMPGPGKHK